MGAGVALALLAAAVPALDPVPASAASASHRSAHTRIANVHRFNVRTASKGITTWDETFSASGGFEAAHFAEVDLTHKDLFVDSVSANNLIDGVHETVPDMANRTKAVAGMNADFFYLGGVNTGPAMGGVVHNGVIWKTPWDQWDANLFARPDGTVGIGATPFTGSVVDQTATARLRKAHPHAQPRPVVEQHIWSVNGVDHAEQGGAISLLTSHLGGTPAQPRCVEVFTAVLGPSGHQQRKITKIATNRSRIDALSGSDEVLYGCGSGGRWLANHVRRGDVVTAQVKFTAGPLQSLVSGGQILVRHTKAYYDHTGHPVSGRNSEAFACVDQTGRQLLLGTIDQRGRSLGITPGDLRVYLQGYEHCYDAIMFDGGGSSTLVARYGSAAQVTELSKPADFSDRPVPDGVFVYRK